MDDRVTGADGPLGADDHGRGNELVVLATGVAGLDRRGSRLGPLPHPVDDRIVATLDPVPPTVAIHRVVAPADRRNPDIGMDRRKSGLEVQHEPDGRTWWRVASIEQRMDPDTWDAQGRRQLDDRDEMTIVGVDPARTDQAHQVEAAVRSRGLQARRHECGSGRERPVGNRGVDPWQVLEHGPSRTQVQMADLGVAHLPGRQADRVLGGPQDRVRPVTQQPAPDGHVGRCDGVDRRVVTDPEAVEHDQDDRARPCATASIPGQSNCPRAAAVTPARATIPAISSGLSDAPPTSAPSIDGSAMNSSIADDVTLPP